MRKIARVAAREFLTTVATRGFIIGLLVVPVAIGLSVIVGPRLFRPRDYAVHGQVAVIDPTGRVAPELRTTISAAHIAERRTTLARQSLAAVPTEIQQLTGRGGSAVGGDGLIARMLGGVPDLRLIELAPTADVQQEKPRLYRIENPKPLALAVVHPDALVPGAGGAYGTYDLYVAANLDDRLENQIHQSLREAIVNARLKVRGLDPSQVDEMVRVGRVTGVRVSGTDERRSQGVLNRVLPFAFAALLMLGVMMGGQALLTSTIEEKSSRVIEVLLSAVSPLELMAGKILGQLGVALVALSLYVSLGIVLLLAFALLGLLNGWLVLYLLLFFLISYLVVGSLMAAVGAAVSELSEAQTLMTPIVLIVVLPMLLAVPITADPNSRLALVMSFLPPVNTFGMLLRMTSSAPPPWWQVWLSIGVGVGSAFAAIWFAARVFQIGLLMYGKPPNYATLIRWVRQT
jgi:ABC-2 type transport system permease protein